MTSATNRTRVLNPLERFSEIVFGLIMVLSFTGALSVAEVGREDIRIMLFGAIGCNLAWGIIDAAFYLINCLTERGRNATILRSVQRATNHTHAQRIIADALPEPVATALQPTDFERVREHLSRLPTPNRPTAAHGGELARSHRRLPARLSLHVPRGCAVSLHARRQAGVARLKCRRHRDALRSGLPARRLRRHAPHSHRPRDGRHRRRAGGAHDCPRRLMFPTRRRIVVISAIGPVATLFLAWAILGERANAGQAIGFVLTQEGGIAPVGRQRLFNRFEGNGAKPARRHLRTRFATNRPSFGALIFLAKYFSPIEVIHMRLPRLTASPPVTRGVQTLFKGERCPLFHHGSILRLKRRDRDKIAERVGYQKPSHFSQGQQTLMDPIADAELSEGKVKCLLATREDKGRAAEACRSSQVLPNATSNSPHQS